MADPAPVEIRHHGVAARLYFVAILGALAVLILAASSLLFANRTRNGVRIFHDVDLAEVVIASDLEVMLERHRRIIESAPIALDRKWIEREALTANGIMRALKNRVATTRDPALVNLKPELDNLETLSQTVLDVTKQFSQIELASKAARNYGAVAGRLLTEVQKIRGRRLAQANEHVTALVESSEALVSAVLASTAGVLAVLIALSAVVVRTFVQRLQALTGTVLRLARNDTSVTICESDAEDEVGDIARAVAVFKNNAIALLDHKKRIEQLNVWFEIALDNMARGLSMFDSSRKLVVCNRRYGEMYRLTEELIKPGTAFQDILRHRIRSGTGRVGDSEENMLKGWPLFDGSTAPVILRHELVDGRVLSISYQPLEDGGWVAVHEDVTEKTKADDSVATLARQDALTELSNRRHFHEEIERSLKSIEKYGAFAVLWIDLDKFKQVNDTFGHPAGDVLLQKVAARLRSTVRSADFVARLGGDEFAIIQYGVPSVADNAAMGKRIIKVLSEDYEIGGQFITIGASVGVARAPDHGSEAEVLLKHADIALYQAKSQGRGDVVVYEAEFESHLRDRRQLESDLRGAIGRGELTLYYQPIFDLKTASVASCEALLRWRHPQRGFVSPGVFIPIAEEAGLISELGAFALAEACRAAASWPGHVRVSVNLSAAQVRAGGLLEVATQSLHESGLNASRLDLEVTETLLLQDDAKTLEMLFGLQAMGISISLDDFGTGYASLSYLRIFPFDRVKIDQTFIRDLPVKPHCQAIIHAVVQLARMLGMQSVAEGVETLEQLQHVRAAGCSEAQGFLMARPVPEDQVMRVMTQAEDELAILLARGYDPVRKRA